MAVRKNFLFDEETAEHLAQLANNANVTQTKLVKKLIEDEYSKISIEEKLEAFNSIVGCMNGLVGDDVSIQSIKTEMGSNL